MRNAANYDIGDAVKLTGEFTDPVTGNPEDPVGSISVTIRDPSGNEVSQNYPGNVTRVSTGIYTYTTVVDSAGTWFYRWASIGEAQEEQHFYVKAGIVTAP